MILCSLVLLVCASGSSIAEQLQVASGSSLPSARATRYEVPTLPIVEGSDEEVQRLLPPTAVEDNVQDWTRGLSMFARYIEWWKNFRDPTDTNTIKELDYQENLENDIADGDRKKRDVTDVEKASDDGSVKEKREATPEGTSDGENGEKKVELRNLRKFYDVDHLTGKVRVKRTFCLKCFRPKYRPVPVYRPVYYVRPARTGCCNPCGGCGYGKK